MKIQRKIILIIVGLFHLLGWCSAQGVIGNVPDSEFDTYCMMDSIGPNNEVEFVRLYYYNKDTFKDVSADLSSSYSVSGTALPCWQLTGTKECWLMNYAGDTEFRFSYGLSVGQVDTIDTDYWLVALRLREYFDLFLPSNRRDWVIPLNYPYGNTVWEADRLAADLLEYFECKGICVGLITVPNGTHALSPNIDMVHWLMGAATYSRDPASPNPKYINDAPFVTDLGLKSCSQVHDVYRKEKNGAILYYVDPGGNLNAPPLPFSKQKINCEMEVERVAHCDRPTASSECWASTLQNDICSYTFIIPDSLEIDSIWINGEQILTETYCPVQSTSPFCPSHNALKDSITARYDDNNWWGRVSVDNTVNGKPGFLINVAYTDMPIDSIETNSGGTIYPIIEDCRSYSFYSLARNELGGIVSCQDQYGHDMFCPPESARRVSCESAEGKAGCRVQGMWGTEVVTASQDFVLSNYWTFSYIVKDTPVVVKALNFAGDTVTIDCPVGFSEKYTSPDPCKLIQSEYLNLNATGGGKIKVSYGW